MPFPRLLPALLGLSSLACASLRAPLTCPEQGGAPWSEVTSEHFVLRTDAEPAEARALVDRFEGLHDALAFVAQRPAARAGAGERIEAVHFVRHKDFMEMVGGDRTIGAYFVNMAPGDLEAQPTLVLQGADMAEDARETFLHELSHRFLHDRFAALPTWLNEGLAQYYETLQLTGGRVVLGATGRHDFSDRAWFWESWRGNTATLQIPRGKAPSIWKLVDGDRSAFYVEPRSASSTPETERDKREQKSANYGAAWKLVHYFLDGPDAGDRARFATFLAAVQRGEPAREAFLTTFGAEMPRLEAAFRRYLTETGTARRVVELRTEGVTREARVRPMRDAEVHLLWARLLPRKDPAATERVRRQLDEALAREPGSGDVHHQRAAFFLVGDRLDDAAREVEAALAVHPDEPRYLFARLAVHDAPAEAAKQAPPPAPPEIVERLARSATSATELHAVAIHQLRAGRTAEAEATLRRALELGPHCWRCQRTRAGMLADAGRKDEALAAVDRALALLPDGASPESLLKLRREIAAGRPPR